MSEPQSMMFDGMELGAQLPPGDAPVVRLLDPLSLADRYQEIALMLDSALARSWQLEATRATLRRALDSGNAWVIAVDYDGRLLAAAVIEKIETVSGPALNIWLCSGTLMIVWLGSMLDLIEDFAHGMGIEAVMLCGRPGWKWALRKYGYHCQAVTMAKRVTA